jgi:hypothetical protein
MEQALHRAEKGDGIKILFVFQKYLSGNKQLALPQQS